MERQKKIIDANIGVKWFAKEDGSDSARSILKDHIEEHTILCVPELFVYELTNALRYKKTTVDQLKAIVHELFDFQLEYIPITEMIMEKAAELSFHYQLTIYDAVYLALAETLNARLITTDEKIMNTKHPLLAALPL